MMKPPRRKPSSRPQGPRGPRPERGQRPAGPDRERPQPVRPEEEEWQSRPPRKPRFQEERPQQEKGRPGRPAGAKPGRPSRSGGAARPGGAGRSSGAARPERRERPEREGRPERGTAPSRPRPEGRDRAERPERGERSERPERRAGAGRAPYPRSEREGRPERPGRGTGPSRPRPAGRDRAERPERGERPERRAPMGRPASPERREARPERPAGAARGAHHRAVPKPDFARSPHVEFGDAREIKEIWKAGTMLYPTPAVLVSTVGRDGKPNMCTVAWIGTVCSEPPMLSISLRPERLSHENITQTRQFVVNIPSEGLIRKTDYCGVVSGREIDKFEQTGLTVAPASQVQAPILIECPVNLECVVSRVLELGTHTMFIAEIVAVQVTKDLITQTGRLALEKVGLVAYVHGGYFPLGERLGKFGYSIRKKK